VKLSNFVEINPRTTLAKGTFAEFVPMEAISPTRRYVHTYPKKKYSGGTKFVSGDTLFARITPCLENGKIAQFVSTLEEPAFGSTEYWIFRAKKGISDPAYVYYLAKSDLLRKPAEKSMVGASGRQRAQIEAVQNIDVGDISIEDQHQVATVLSAYDDLIENNSKRVDKLESMARLIYRNIMMTCDDLSEVCLDEVAETRRGISWERSNESGSSEGIRVLTIPNVQRHISLNGATRLVNIAPSHSETYSVANDDILMVGSNGNPDRVGSVARYGSSERVLFASFLMRIRADKSKISPKILYLLLNDPQIVSPLRSGAIGVVTLRNIRITSLRSLKFVIPSVQTMKELDRSLDPIFDLIDTLQKKNDLLASARDLILPRLMSGEIEA
jgi:type I restriction enzyme S subunit